MSGLHRLNALPAEDAERELLTCCGSRAWARRMADWREAFRSHPRIGERKAGAGQTGRERAWSAGEQAGMAAAADATRDALAEGNRAYEARFGYIYIVCATGRSADEMLALLRARLANDDATEIRVAAEEQRKITRIRLEKLLASA